MALGKLKSKASIVLRMGKPAWAMRAWTERPFLAAAYWLAKRSKNLRCDQLPFSAWVSSSW